MENKDILTEGADIILGWLQAAVDTLVEQAPLLAEAIVLRGLITNYVDIGVCAAVLVTILVVSQWLGRKLMQKYNECVEKNPGGYNELDLGAWAVRTVGGIGALITFFVGVSQVHDLILIYAAPRLYVIQQVAKLF